MTELESGGFTAEIAQIVANDGFATSDQLEAAVEREQLRAAVAELGARLAALVNAAQPVEHRQGGSSLAHFRAHGEAVDTLIKYGFGA